MQWNSKLIIRHTCFSLFCKFLTSFFCLFWNALLSLQGVSPAMSALAASTALNESAAVKAVAAKRDPTCSKNLFRHLVDNLAKFLFGSNSSLDLLSLVFGTYKNWEGGGARLLWDWSDTVARQWLVKFTTNSNYKSDFIRWIAYMQTGLPHDRLSSVSWSGQEGSRSAIK